MALLLKGFIIGIGKIIPGVSGSLLAIRLNVYEQMIAAINNLFNDFKKNICFLFKIGLGILLAILLGSKLIIFLLDAYRQVTIILFVILIGTGIPLLLRETKNYYLALVSFLLYFIITYLPNLQIFNNYYIMGFLEAATTIIPGISGTALFMALGVYDELLELFSHVYLLELDKLIPFSIGLFLGTIILVHFIDYCFKNYRSKTYAVILGLLLGSMVVMLIKR